MSAHVNSKASHVRREGHYSHARPQEGVTHRWGHVKAYKRPCGAWRSAERGAESARFRGRSA